MPAPRANPFTFSDVEPVATGLKGYLDYLRSKGEPTRGRLFVERAIRPLKEKGLVRDKGPRPEPPETEPETTP